MLSHMKLCFKGCVSKVSNFSRPLGALLGSKCRPRYGILRCHVLIGFGRANGFGFAHFPWPKHEPLYYTTPSLLSLDNLLSLDRKEKRKWSSSDSLRDCEQLGLSTKLLDNSERPRDDDKASMTKTSRRQWGDLAADRLGFSFFLFTFSFLSACSKF